MINYNQINRSAYKILTNGTLNSIKKRFKKRNKVFEAYRACKKAKHSRNSFFDIDRHCRTFYENYFIDSDNEDNGGSGGDGYDNNDFTSPNYNNKSTTLIDISNSLDNFYGENYDDETYLNGDIDFEQQFTTGHINCLSKRHMLSLLPKSRCNFNLEILKRRPFNFARKVDLMSLVSLAALNCHMEDVAPYADKILMMCINVSRLIFTTEAFYKKNITYHHVHEALKFYIKTDIEINDRITTDLYNEKQQIFQKMTTFGSSNIAPATISSNAITIPSLATTSTSDAAATTTNSSINQSSMLLDLLENEKFCNLLHRLKLPCYIDYIFELANKLNMHVDLIQADSLVFRYMNKTSISSCVLTVISNGAEWYVQCTDSFVVSTC